MKPATLLLADPPWKFGDSLPGRWRGSGRNYKCMTVEQLSRYRLPPLADDCLLLLWRCAALQREALDVMHAWGFTLKSELVWVKLRSRGARHFGMGRYVRAGHEVCLIGVRGRVKVADRSVRSVFDAPMPPRPGGRIIHSAKPDEIYAIARRLVPRGPAVELFARQQWPGWTCVGHQARRGGARRAMAA